ncbi:MAG: tetratricopeptide repeat protein [Candidatus Woesearchaeota archaeon]|nr:tetratricopeptide repeat protein [Candidatus Woesearchaeota archaeon]
MEKQSISLCLITKNEEKYLEQCLNSVKGIVDEIIVVDTGSDDKTKEIAKKFNAKIFDFKWVDDFSAARNESLKHATKEWILVLDADEILDEEGLKTVKDFVKDKENDGFLFLKKNYTNDNSVAGFVLEKHKNFSGWYGSFIVRLFRNKKGFKFEGTVHELVEPSIENKKGKIAATNVFVHHYGNSDSSVIKKKRQFYLELCKKKVKQKPNASSYHELGILYRENNKLDDAIKSFKKAIQLNPKHSMSFFEIGVIYEHQQDYDKAIKNYTESLRIKESSEVFQNLGVCFLKKGKLKEAYRNLTKSLLLNPNKYTIYNNLGAVQERLGNYDSAIQMLQIGVKLNPNNVIGHYNLAIAYDKKGDFEKALESYLKTVELGHRKKEKIKERINQLKAIVASSPNYGYSFKYGG